MTQMVYPQKNVADMIAAKLTKHKGVEYAVKKGVAGFEVAPLVEQPKDHSEHFVPAKPKTATNYLLQVKNMEEAMGKPADDGFTLKTGEAVTITMKLKNITPEWISASHEGKPFWVEKKSLLSWSATNNGDGKLVHLHMTLAYAKKRGLV